MMRELALPSRSCGIWYRPRLAPLPFHPTPNCRIILEVILEGNSDLAVRDILLIKSLVHSSSALSLDNLTLFLVVLFYDLGCLMFPKAVNNG